ncbi:antitoxin VbhA family protein (plasmid) [Oscillospiraceae bacterium PP1C4]
MSEKNTTKEERTKAWDYALGMIKVDGLNPSEDFLKLVEKEKNGDISIEDVIKALDHKYKVKES